MVTTLANQITILRILLIPFFVSFILYYSPQKDYLRFWALAIFLLAAMFDLVDGFIARNYQQMTKAGAMLDPVADKLLLVSGFTSLYMMGGYFPSFQLPIWLVVAAISRDVIICLGVIIILMTQGNLKINPTFWGKATTFAQVLSIVCMLLQLKVSPYIWDVTLVLIIISGLDYIRSGIKLFNNGVEL